MFSNRIHRILFLLSTCLIAIALPFSPLLLSLGQFILIGNWIFEFGYKAKFKTLLERKSILIFCLLFLTHILWLLNTQNFNYAIHDIKIKLPLLGLPIIYGTTNPLTRNEIRIVLHFFLASVLAATLVSLIVFLGLTKIEPLDNRAISIFISHIRFSLLIDLGIYILISLLICNKHFQLIASRYYLIVLGWFLAFILFLGAFTGLIILFLVAPFALLFWLNTKQEKKYKRWATIVLSVVIIGAFSYLGYAIKKYSSREEITIATLEKFTQNGNKYAHFPNMYDYENNQRVWLYVCDKELEKEWGKVSDIEYKGKDCRGQLVRTTLVRYLTSMGCRKDSAGFSKLSDQDIKMIEEGYTNTIYKKRLSIYPRLYQLFWEIEFYLRHGNPSGHSLTQRVEYIKNASHVIKRHFWFGTGTGDVEDEIQLQYAIDNSLLDNRWQLRAHNQIVTFFLSFGLLGFLILLFSIFKTLSLEKHNIDFISLALLLIVLFSMFNEDTFETQAGASFFAFFFSLLIFGRKLSAD
jgi:hypothetical protein